jgi:hypothetical protein
MARYFLHRFLLTLPALWLVLTMVFLLIHIVPGDPVEQMLGESAAPGQAAELRHTLGLDRPLIVQYGKYLWQVARGDFGQSFKFQAPVRQVIFERYPAMRFGEPLRTFLRQSVLARIGFAIVCLLVLLAPWISPAKPRPRKIWPCACKGRRSLTGWARTNWGATSSRAFCTARACRCSFPFAWCWAAARSA